MAKPTLHHLNHSQSQRVLWLIEELGIDYNLVNHLRTKEKLAPESLKQISPSGSAPALETADGRIVIESMAIIRYLLRVYDKDNKFHSNYDATDSSDAWLREEELISYCGTSFGFLVQFGFIVQFIMSATPWFMRWLPRLVMVPVLNQFIYPRVKLQLSYLQEQLGEEKWFSGKSEPGILDFLFSFPFDMATERKMCELEMWPKLDAWHKRVRARPAWKRALDKTPGYDWGIY